MNSSARKRWYKGQKQDPHKISPKPPAEVDNSIVSGDSGISGTINGMYNSSASSLEKTKDPAQKSRQTNNRQNTNKCSNSNAKDFKRRRTTATTNEPYGVSGNDDASSDGTNDGSSSDATEKQWKKWTPN